MRLGAYEVEGELGRGGFAVVYKARGDGRDVAIKLLLHPDKRQALARFERERELLEQFGMGEGFVPLIDRGESPAGPYLVMPFLGGGTLRDRLRSGPLPVDDALSLGRSLARALGRAHARGIVHRDVKPENILFDGGGRPFIADLGLAKNFAAAEGAALSRTGTLLGTPGYMAPEQMRDAKEVGPSADVFALGAILHECLSGEAAFAGETPIEVISKVESGRRGQLPPGAPSWLAAALDRATAVDPTERFPDGDAFARGLEPGAAAPSRSPRILIIGAAALAVAGLGGWLATRDRAPASIATPRDDAHPTSAVETSRAPARHGIADGRALKLTDVLGGWDWTLPATPARVEVSRDGSLLLALLPDSTARAIDLKTGAEVASLAVKEGAELPAFTLLPSGEQALFARRGQVETWDVRHSRVVARFTPSDPPVAFLPSPDGKRVVVVEPKRLEAWDLAKSAKLREIPFDVEGAGKPELGFDGDRVLIIERVFGHVERWDIATGVRDHPRLPGDTRVAGISRDARETITWNTRSFVARYDLLGAEQRPEASPLGLVDVKVTRLDVAPDGILCLATGAEGEPVLWDLTRGERLAAPFPLARAMTAPHGLLVDTDDGALRVHDVVHDLAISRPTGHGAPVVDVGWTRDGRVVSTGGGVARVRDPRGVAKELALDGALRLAIAGDQAIAATRSSTLVTWFFDRREPVTLPNSMRADVLAASPSGRALVVCGAAGTAWDVPAGKSLGGFMGGADAATVRAMAVSRDGRLGAVAGWYDDLRLYTFPPVTLQRALGGREKPTSLAFLADGRLAAGYENGALAIWDVTTAARAEKHAHRGGVDAVAASPRGSTVATAGRDGAIKIWSADGEPRELDTVSLAGAGDAATALAWSPDGTRLAAGTRRGVVIVFAWSER